MLSTTFFGVRCAAGEESCIQKNQKSLLCASASLDIALGVIALLGAATLAVLTCLTLRCSALSQLPGFRAIKFPLPAPVAAVFPLSGALGVIGLGQIATTIFIVKLLLRIEKKIKYAEKEIQQEKETSNIKLEKRQEMNDRKQAIQASLIELKLAKLNCDLWLDSINQLRKLGNKYPSHTARLEEGQLMQERKEKLRNEVVKLKNLLNESEALMSAYVAEEHQQDEYKEIKRTFYFDISETQNTLAKAQQILQTKEEEQQAIDKILQDLF